MELKKNKLFTEKAYINGEWRDSSRTFNVINPATEKTIAKVADFGVKEVVHSVEAANKALPSWQTMTAHERSDILMKWYALIHKNQDSLTELMTSECGKPIQESIGELSYGASFVLWYAEEGKRAYGDTIPSANSSNRIVTIRQGIGVVAAITPWNFPLAMITRKVAPAL